MVPSHSSSPVIDQYIYLCCDDANTDCLVMFSLRVQKCRCTSAVSSLTLDESKIQNVSVLAQYVREESSAANFANTVGDFNGDGISDVAWVDHYANYSHNSHHPQHYHFAKIYVLFGRTSGLNSTPDFTSITPNEGVTIWGPGPKAGCASHACYYNDQQMRLYAGDLNADGVDELIVASPTVATNKDGATQHDNGRVDVIFGTKRSAWSASMDLSDHSTFTGFTFWPRSSSSGAFGSGVQVDDFNGDGVNDLAVLEPAPAAASGGKWTIYVLYGRQADETVANMMMTVSDLDGVIGVVIESKSGDEMTEVMLYGADINGDGITDLIVDQSSNTYSGTAKTYVIHGSKAWPQTIRLEVIDGSNGFEVLHDKKEMLRSEFLTTGDFNGDNIEDLAISNPFYDSSHKMGAGAVWVVFGGASRSSSTLNVSSLDGSNGFMMIGDTGARGIGASLGKGDFNGDGITDLVMGSFGATVSGGKVYMVYGRREPFEASYVLDSEVLNGTNNGVVLESSGELQVVFIRVGDYNRDGIADMILFSSYMEEIDIVYGRSHFDSTFNISASTEANSSSSFKVHAKEPFVDCAMIPLTRTFDVDFNGDDYLDLLFDWVRLSHDTAGFSNVYRILYVGHGREIETKTRIEMSTEVDADNKIVVVTGIGIATLFILLILVKVALLIKKKTNKKSDIRPSRFVEEAQPNDPTESKSHSCH